MTKNEQIKDAGVYIDPLSDWGWKTLFGSERYKEHLISFINAVYPELKVTDISYDNVEDQGDSPLSRNTRFDLFCSTAKGESVLVEVQKSQQKYFFERGLWTSSFKIRDQAPAGKWDYHLKGVYSIGILTFPPEKISDFDWDDDTFFHTFSLREDNDYRRMTGLYRFAFISVDKFHKKPEELDNILEKWLYLFRNLRRLDDRPEELRERIFESFFKAAEIARMPRQEQEQYRRTLMSENDWLNAIDYAEEKGGKKATEKVARKLLALDVRVDTIIEATGLSEAEVLAL